jgi:2-polyprenyl-3-methyl-5-hydroxy-6-metoxy-1,4-benzoquinol methylase
MVPILSVGEPMRPCPACLSDSSRPAGEANSFELCRCASCRTLFTARLPRDGEAKEYEEYYHEENLTVPPFVERRLEEIVSTFDDYRKLNTWLDVGCGAGALMRAAGTRGWEVVGTEVSESSVTALRKQGLEVHLGELQALDLPAFDVVSLVEVVEHVPAPRELVADAARLLRPGGALYITTPHGRGVSARVLRTEWSAVTPPEHLQLFSTRGLRTIVNAAGLEVRAMQTHAFNPYELLDAVRKQDVRPLHRVESAYELNESLSGSPVRELVKRTANGTLNTLRLGDALKLVAS